MSGIFGHMAERFESVPRRIQRAAFRGRRRTRPRPRALISPPASPCLFGTRNRLCRRFGATVSIAALIWAAPKSLRGCLIRHPRKSRKSRFRCIRHLPERASEFEYARESPRGGGDSPNISEIAEIQNTEISKNIHGAAKIAKNIRIARGSSHRTSTGVASGEWRFSVRRRHPLSVRR